MHVSAKRDAPAARIVKCGNTAVCNILSAFCHLQLTHAVENVRAAAGVQPATADLPRTQQPARLRAKLHNGYMVGNFL